MTQSKILTNFSHTRHKRIILLMLTLFICMWSHLKTFKNIYIFIFICIQCHLTNFKEVNANYEQFSVILKNKKKLSVS